MAYGEERPYEVISPKAKPERRRRAIWGMASDLQSFGGYSPSSFAHRVAERYMAGSTTAADALESIESHGESHSLQGDSSHADVLAMRALMVLDDSDHGTGTYLTPFGLGRLHYLLYRGLVPSETAISWRGGRSGGTSAISTLLKSAFMRDFERRVSCPPGSKRVLNLADFVAELACIEPFIQGNEETIAIFAQLYLDALGYDLGASRTAWSGSAYRLAMTAARSGDVDAIESFYQEMYG
jgi:hypothetical protein